MFLLLSHTTIVNNLILIMWIISTMLNQCTVILQTSSSSSSSSTPGYYTHSFHVLYVSNVWSCWISFPLAAVCWCAATQQISPAENQYLYLCETAPVDHITAWSYFIRIDFSFFWEMGKNEYKSVFEEEWGGRSCFGSKISSTLFWLKSRQFDWNTYVAAFWVSVTLMKNCDMFGLDLWP